MKLFNLYKRTPLLLTDEAFTIKVTDIQSVAAIKAYSSGDYVVIIRHGGSVAEKRSDTCSEAQGYVAQVTELMVQEYA